MELENPLWNFALKFYARPGVEQACLAMQDQFGCSINRLIFACWAGQQGLQLQADDFAAEPAEGWQQEITYPLRQLRYRVRIRRQQDATFESCYQALRQAELACEQVELALLFSIARDRLPVVTEPVVTRRNLYTYFAALKQDCQPAVQYLLVLEEAAPEAFATAGLVSE